MSLYTSSQTTSSLCILLHVNSFPKKAQHSWDALSAEQRGRWTLTPRWISRHSEGQITANPIIPQSAFHTGDKGSLESRQSSNMQGDRCTGSFWEAVTGFRQLDLGSEKANRLTCQPLTSQSILTWEKKPARHLVFFFLFFLEREREWENLRTWQQDH